MENLRAAIVAFIASFSVVGGPEPVDLVQADADAAVAIAYAQLLAEVSPAVPDVTAPAPLPDKPKPAEPAKKVEPPKPKVKTPTRPPETSQPQTYYRRGLFGRRLW